MHYLVEGMRVILEWFYHWTGSYGLAIILLTVLIRVVLYPLFLSQMKASAAMRVLSPKLKELQEKYKDNPQEYQKQLFTLYREHKVNPMGGCLPALIQIPFMYALFRLLGSFKFEQAGFLWVADLGKPDPFFLPLLAGLTTYWQTRSMNLSQDSSSQTMQMIFPLFTLFISRSFPAGLALYWVASNLVAVAQQYWVNRHLDRMYPPLETKNLAEAPRKKGGKHS